jgi:hypothetical protein
LTPTESVGLALMPTVVASVTPTDLPGVGLPLAVSAIEPALVSNERPASLTLRGTNFVDGLAVKLGGLTLEDVELRSATSLTASLPAGVCPGRYDATVTDPLGRQASGGQVVIEGKRAITLGASVAGPTIKLNGRSQELTIPLPDVQAVDTTCDGDLRLAFSLGPFTHSAARSTLVPQLIQLGLPGAIQAAKTALDGHVGPTEAQLSVPRSAAGAQVTLNPSVQVRVPANAYAGQYTATTTVTIVEGP